MKFISLFAGIGGLDLGLERAGMECVAQVEIDDFCQKVLTKHWANVPKYKDVRDVGKDNLPPADLICGGFPCQDVSLAGKRAGLEGKRSTLWSEFYRIVCEIRPRWVVIENVTGLLSSDNGEFFTKILRELSESGYDAEWAVISAASVGSLHQRDRVIILAYSNGLGQLVFQNQPRSGKEKYREQWTGFIPTLGASHCAREQWRNEPSVGRVVDGVSAELDEFRIKSLGNAVVPQVAEFIGNCVMKAETCLTKREPDVCNVTVDVGIGE